MFSNPNPLLPASLASVKQTGCPLLKPAVAAATGGGATPGVGDIAAEGATLFDVTRQLAPSSNPKPSLSWSEALLRHSGCVLLLVVLLTAGVFCCTPELVTLHERLFSKPNPSPSGSLDAEIQAG